MFNAQPWALKRKVCKNTKIFDKCGITFLKKFFGFAQLQIIVTNVSLPQNIEAVNPQHGDKSCGRDVNLRIK